MTLTLFPWLHRYDAGFLVQAIGEGGDVTIAVQTYGGAGMLFETSFPATLADNGKWPDQNTSRLDKIPISTMGVRVISIWVLATDRNNQTNYFIWDINPKNGKITKVDSSTAKIKAA